MPRDSKISLYVATKSLETKYKFEYNNIERAEVRIPAAQTHAVLAGSCKEMFALRDGLKYGTGKSVYKAGEWNEYNFATATLTLLYTDTSAEEGYLGEDIEKAIFAVSSDKTSRILSTSDFYTSEYRLPDVHHTKAGRDSVFVSLLTNRVRSFAEIEASYFYNARAVTSEAALTVAIEESMFHERFHHSEQALMHYMNSAELLNKVLRQLQLLKAAYLYGMVLDIYTQRMLCDNCNIGLLGMQRSQRYGFLSDLSSLLASNRIQTRVGGNLMLSTRVSASKPGKGSVMEALRLPSDKDVVHDYNPDKNFCVLQAESKALGTEAMLNASKEAILPKYPGIFFSSSHIKSKETIERALASVR